MVRLQRAPRQPARESSKRTRGTVAAVAALAVSLMATTASAQDAKELARARERFKEAAASQAAGDFARALEAYKEVALVKSSATVRFNIATCEEKTGDYVRAMGSYRLALTEATRSNAKDIETAVQKALADLEPRIPALTVTRGDGAAVASVTLDDRPLSNPQIGVEFQVNPGPHTVKATSPDREPMSVDITLGDRDKKTIQLVLKAKAKAAPVVVAPVVDEPEQPPPPPPGPNKPMLIGGIAAGAIGVAGVVVAGVFFGMRQSAISTLTKECGAGGSHCPADAQTTYNHGQTDAAVSTAGLVVGVVGLAAGTTLVVLATRKKSEPKPSAGFTLTPTGGALYGKF